MSVISTGSLALDIALGVGIPRKDCEIYGPESSGKTTLAHLIAEAQKAGGIAAFIDVEHAGSRLCQEFGVDIDNLLISQPDMAEQAQIAEACCGAVMSHGLRSGLFLGRDEGEMGVPISRPARLMIRPE